MSDNLFDRTGFAILKLNGVFPMGLNRLHVAINEMNKEFFQTGKLRERIGLLRSEFKTSEHEDCVGYTVEIRVPYMMPGVPGKVLEKRKVPAAVLLALAQAINAFE